MTKTNKTNKAHCVGTCVGGCNSCSHVDTAKTAYSNVDGAQSVCEKTELDYGFYSNVLSKPFERLEDLKAAEAAYYDSLRIKEEKAAAKKADAQKVEEAFKALNATRKLYKEKLSQLTAEYSEALATLKKTFDYGKKDLQDKLAAAEDNYSKALKEFTDAHPEGYHLTLKDGDFETTLSGSGNTAAMNHLNDTYADIFKLIFGL